MWFNVIDTRETELPAERPATRCLQVDREFDSVATRNYLQVRDEDFEREAGAVRHNPLPQVAELVGNARQGDEIGDEPCSEKPKKRDENLPPTRRAEYPRQESNQEPNP